MVTTSLVVPQPLIQRYISSFELRTIDTGRSTMQRPLHALPESSISLFINSDHPGFLPYHEQIPAFVADEYSYPLAGIMGIQTFMRGTFVFKGRYKILNINFQPSGVYELFGIHATVLTDKLFNAYRVIGHEIAELHQYIQQAEDRNIFMAAEEWAAQLYNRALNLKFRVWPDLPILINAAANNETIEHLALMANMSVKTFERNFNMFVGVGPKLFAQIHRFNQVIAFKKLHPAATWSYISNKFQFYDQMHFIKEFKHFAGETPARFFRNTPPPAETFI